jgi:carbohydrate-selective porin OprB
MMEAASARERQGRREKGRAARRRAARRRLAWQRRSPQRHQRTDGRPGMTEGKRPLAQRFTRSPGRGAGLLAAALACWPVAAWAQQGQTETGSKAPALLIPIEPPEALPDTGTAGGFSFNLRPLGAGLGRTLADHGVYVVGSELAEPLGNVSGGVKQGGFFEGLTTAGLDFDMARIAGIQGGAVHFLLSDIQGQNFAAYSGSSYLNNRIFAGDGPTFRLNELSYEQSLFDKGLNLRIGRIPAYTQFDGSELYCTFVTTLCRTPAAYTFDRGYPPYPASSYAAVLQARISGPFYANIAVYENEPVLSTTSHHGFPGRDWGLNYANGATVPVQLGYRTTAQDDRFPRAFAVGGFYNTGRYADPLLNASGQSRARFGGPARTDTGASQIYVQGQQMVYRPDTSDKGLTLFAGANWAASGQPSVQRMVFGGAYWKGPISGRPNDTLGTAVSLVSVNPRIAARAGTVLSKSSGGQASRSEISYEVNYGVAVAPGLTLKPFVQLISHPDQSGSVAPSGNNTQALFVGALFEANMASLFGLPTLGR